jgi:hypothetical protein
MNSIKQKKGRISKQLFQGVFCLLFLIPLCVLAQKQEKIYYDKDWKGCSQSDAALSGVYGNIRTTVERIDGLTGKE